MSIYAIFMAAGVLFLVTIAITLVRAFLGPTVWDRILATNVIGTKTVIFVTLLGFIMKRPEFLDIALLYAVLNFVATIAILKFVEHKRIG
jgi:multicomponent Na+:H+ antiporter subunit F